MTLDHSMEDMQEEESIHTMHQNPFKSTSYNINLIIIVVYMIKWPVDSRRESKHNCIIPHDAACFLLYTPHKSRSDGLSIIYAHTLYKGVARYQEK